MKVERKEKLSFPEFLDLFDGYGELEFSYRNKTYGLNGTATTVNFFMIDNHFFNQQFQTTQEFAEKANINGVLLKNIWEQVNDIWFSA